MGSFLITCLKSLSIYTLLSKNKISLEKKNPNSNKLVSIQIQGMAFINLWMQLCLELQYGPLPPWSFLVQHSTASLLPVPTRLGIYQGPTLMWFKSEGNNRHWPVVLDMLAHFPGLASTSNHVAWRPTGLTLFHVKTCVFTIGRHFPRAMKSVSSLKKGTELLIYFSNVHLKKGFWFCFVVVQHIYL